MEDGGLAPANSFSVSGIKSWRAGLGRVVLVWKAPQPEDLDHESWWEAAAFLWKYSRIHVPSISKQGRWRDSAERKWLETSSDLDRAREKLLGYFLPSGLRVLPFSLLFFLLLIFFAAAGPVDYFLLGLLKKRRLTWIYQPSLCAGFALFLVWLANIYHGNPGSQKSMAIVDHCSRGRVLRESLYAFHISGFHEELETTKAGALFAPVSAWELDPFPERGSPFFASEFSGGEDLPSIEGKFPGRYRIRRKILKWNPCASHSFAIGRESKLSPLKIRWDAVGPDQFRTLEGRERLKKFLFGEANFSGRIDLLHGSEHYGICRSDPAIPMEFILRASSRKRQGIFYLASQLSPAGGDGFDDLAIHDAGDPRQWLLVAASAVEDGFVVHRRLYFEEQP
ncbi:MAG: hypothetical protein HY717_17685 [Planctomycetes bacterium]|nr:hypothetical protein [Planctomycetota bacterium]